MAEDVVSTTFRLGEALDASRWFVIPKPNPHARIRLLCFPYGGGGASIFREWPAGLPPEVEVCAIQFPGRENRLREAPNTRMADLVEALVEALRGRLHAPYALFGHSLGALVAFELARRLMSADIAPAHLFVSGQPAPDLPGLYRPIYQFPEETFVAAVVERYGGIPDSVLRSPQMMRLLLPLLRGDFELGDTYSYAYGEALNCPIAVYRGEEDPETPELRCEGWQRQTSLPLRTRTFPGAHLFINESRGQVLSVNAGRKLHRSGG